jgi:hypothetical protein
MSEAQTGVKNLRKSILDECTPAGFVNVYVIGHRPTQLTVYAQQIRAFRLIWALAEQEKEKAKGEKNPLKDKKIVVVGGGIAGVTAAAAATLHRAEVTLLEQGEELLHLQRGCHTRYLHPRLFEWPHRNARRAGAELPILNWSVGTASDVANRILADFHRIRRAARGSLQERCGVRNVRTGHDRWNSVVWEKDGKTERVVNPHAVILALGFGIENTVKGLPRRSYWRVDSLNQTALDSEDDRYVVLVSGTGDGGITDVLRAKLKNFDHGSFFDECVLRLECDKLRNEIERIETALGAKTKTLKETSPEVTDKILSAFLNEEYAGISEMIKAVDPVLQYVRPQTDVIWVGRAPHPITRNSQPLARLLSWRLVQLGFVKYLPGTLESVETLDQVKPSGFRYRATLQSYPSAPWTIDVHQVVVRHNCDPALKRAFPEVFQAMEAKEAKNRPKQVKEGLEKEIYEDYKNRANDVADEPPLKDIQIHAKPEYCIIRNQSKHYRIKIWIHAATAPNHVSWADYDLHPDEGNVVQRRAMWRNLTAEKAEQGGGEVNNTAVTDQFRHWINTRNDFWIRVRFSDGSEIGDWLSKAIARGWPNGEEKLKVFEESESGGAIGPADPPEEDRKTCLESLRSQAEQLRKKPRKKPTTENGEQGYSALDWCEYFDGVSGDSA